MVTTSDVSLWCTHHIRSPLCRACWSSSFHDCSACMPHTTEVGLEPNQSGCSTTCLRGGASDRHRPPRSMDRWRQVIGCAHLGHAYPRSKTHEETCSNCRARPAAGVAVGQDVQSRGALGGLSRCLRAAPRMPQACLEWTLRWALRHSLHCGPRCASIHVPLGRRGVSGIRGRPVPQGPDPAAGVPVDRDRRSRPRLRDRGHRAPTRVPANA